MMSTIRCPTTTIRGSVGSTGTASRWVWTCCRGAVDECSKWEWAAACSVPTLTQHYREYVGTDLTLAPGLEALVADGCNASFVRADLLQDDLPVGHFDAVVCLSVLEHIADTPAAARSLARTLKPGGTLVAGYPMVSRLMTRAFSMIGFDRIDAHHVAAPAQISMALRTVLTPVRRVASARGPGVGGPLSVHVLDETAVAGVTGTRIEE